MPSISSRRSWTAPNSAPTARFATHGFSSFREANLFEPKPILSDTTTMTTLIDDSRARDAMASPARYFYFNTALACMAVAFLGFAPTYWLPLGRGSFSASPVVHFHGLLFFSWTLYYAFQPWLAASGQTARHRMLGMIGVWLATMM